MTSYNRITVGLTTLPYMLRRDFKQLLRKVDLPVCLAPHKNALRPFGKDMDNKRLYLTFWEFIP